MPTSKKSNKQHNNSKSNKPKRERRWFIGASGWGVSLNAGSGNPSTGMAKREITLPPDVRINLLGGTVITSNFRHNTIYTSNLLNLITQGTADNNRLGDFLSLKTVSLKLHFDTSAASFPTTSMNVRVALIASPTQYTASGFVSGLGSTDLFLSGNSGQLCNAHFDSKRVKVLCDYIAAVAPKAAIGRNSLYHYECDLNCPFEYASGSNFGTTANLYWVLIPSVCSGTSGVTNCGQFFFDQIVTFASV